MSANPLSPRFRSGSHAARWLGLGLLLVLGAGSACGSIPDVRVEVARLAEDTAQLAVVVWQATPLITNAILVINGPADMSAPKVLLLIQGWNFLPSYQVKLQQVRTEAGMVTTTDRSPPEGSISADSPTQLNLTFAKADLMWLEDPRSQLVITIPYGDGKSVTATFPSFSQ